MSHDAVSLLRELRPAQDDFEPDERALERILLAPPAARPRRRRRTRPAIAVALALSLAALAVAITPGLRSSPDVVARAAAALNDPAAILHLKWVQNGRTTELWQADGGRRERRIDEGGTPRAAEHVSDIDRRHEQTYVLERDELITHTEPDLFDPARLPKGLAAAGPWSRPTDDLAGVLDRARRGDANARLVGEATVRDIAVYELRVDYTMEVMDLPPGFQGDPLKLPTKTIERTRTVYVDRDAYLPVRVVESWPGIPTSTTDYLVAERLAATAENERLLEMTPHPGAKRVTEGRV
jgi:hypothetical protein